MACDDHQWDALQGRKTVREIVEWLNAWENPSSGLVIIRQTIAAVADLVEDPGWVDIQSL